MTRRSVGDLNFTQSLQKTAIYAALFAWAFVCLFPIYWTVSTSFKGSKDIYDGDLIPWLQFEPNWKGWESLGLSPDTINQSSSARQEFLKHAANTVTISLSAATLATVIGSLAGYGLARFS